MSDNDYNLLNECKYIKNIDRCLHDTNTGFEALLSVSDCGFTQNDGLSWFHSPGNFMWAMSESSSCYFSLSNPIDPTFEADLFSDCEIELLIKHIDAMSDPVDYTWTAKLMWLTETDTSWEDEASVVFDVIADGHWHRYQFTMLASPRWVGNCNNIRLYPFINGLANVLINFKRIAFISTTHYKCNFPPCAFNDSYAHPCLGIGSFSNITTLPSVNNPYVDATHNRITVAIDDYPFQMFDLDITSTSDPWMIAQAITLQLNTFSFGGYKFAECSYDDTTNTFNLRTGTRGSAGRVVIIPSEKNDAAVALGFFTEQHRINFITELGRDPVDGYQAAFQPQPSTVIYQLVEGDTTAISFDSSLPFVELGRRDFMDISSTKLLKEGQVEGMLLIDVFGRCNVEGKLTAVFFNGALTSKSRIFLLRPVGDQQLVIIYRSSVITRSYKIANKNNGYSVPVNWYVKPGDVLGLYMCLPAAGTDAPSKERPDLDYAFSWVEYRGVNFKEDDILSYTGNMLRFFGHQSLPVYGSSSEKVNGIALEVLLKQDYGVDHVEVIGDPLVDVLTIDLMKLEGTSLQLVTSSGNYNIQSAPTADLNFSHLTYLADWFAIEFTFPGIIPNVHCISLLFEDIVNIRAFSWEVKYEGFIGSSLRLWATNYPFPTPAVGIGSEAPWVRLSNPITVMMDGNKDVTDTLYLGNTYVTGWDNDYYPGLTEEAVEARASQSYRFNWNKLETYYDPFYAHSLRLYVWEWGNTNIESIKIESATQTYTTLLHSIRGLGFSGPLVFDTEQYNIIDRTGAIWSSKRVSRSTNNSYVYDLKFDTTESDPAAAIAPVGTTLNKMQLFISGLPTKLQRLKIVPQTIATEIRNLKTDEALTQIDQLQWGSPVSEPSSVYGEAQGYKVYNHTGHTANLWVDIANSLAANQDCVFDSALSSYNDINDPAIGPAAKLIEEPDVFIANDRGINYRSRVYHILPKVPAQWYSSTTSGAVWQTVTSGYAFVSDVDWNEVPDPHNPGWSVCNLNKAISVTISGGKLNFSSSASFSAAAEASWVNPTYSYSVDLTTSMLLETQVCSTPASFDLIDNSTGIVIFDANDITKFFRIERYSGNGITEETTDADITNTPAIVSGDYVRYGYNGQYNFTVSGTKPPIITIANPDRPLLLRLIKNTTWLEVAYKLAWTTWTTVSAFDISSWSDNLKLGVFSDTTALTRSARAYEATNSCDYIGYKCSDTRTSVELALAHNFMTDTQTHDSWCSLNTNHTTYLKTISNDSSMQLKRSSELSSSTLFNNYLPTPALYTAFGAVSDLNDITLLVNGYQSTTLASGVFSAGAMLSDPTNVNNYLTWMLKTEKSLQLNKDGIITTVTLSDPISSTSGVWLNLNKSYGLVLASYSLDGYNYTVVSGIDIWNWTNDTALNIALTSDFPEVSFSYVATINSAEDATTLIAEFDQAFPLLNVYGTDPQWANVMYSVGSGFDSFTATKPQDITKFKFDKPQDLVIDFTNIKFIPDVAAANRLGYSVTITEVPNANQLLFEHTGLMSSANPTILGDGTGAADPNPVRLKGLPKANYPVLLFDLGQVYAIGRSPIATDTALGRFSTTMTDHSSSVQWETQAAEDAGFKRKCLHSVNNECSAPGEWGKPTIVYGEDGEFFQLFYPQDCDGWEFPDVAATRKSCPFFHCGDARWLMFESNQYTAATASAGTIWNIGSIQAAYSSRPNKLTSNINWWTTDYGLMHWTDNTITEPDYTLVYSYPGQGIPGSCFFNPEGNTTWKITSDPAWTYNDSFVIDLRCSQPYSIQSVTIKLGRDPKCYWLFTLTGSLTSTWQTFQLPYREAQLKLEQFIAVGEDAYGYYDMEHYLGLNAPYLPLPYFNLGYFELTVSGYNSADIYIRNMKNIRNRFIDGYLNLGIQEALYIPDIKLINAGTIALTYLPNPAGLQLISGEPREFLLPIVTISNPIASISVVLDLQKGWSIYCCGGDESRIISCIPTVKESEQIYPTLDKPGPFNLVFSWAPDHIPGLTDSVVLWVNGIKVCAGNFYNLAKYFTTDDVRITLGNGFITLAERDYATPAAYAQFKNLKILKRALSSPIIDSDLNDTVPEALIELSKDNSEWYNFTDLGLPLVYRGVEHGDFREFFIRNRKLSKELKLLQKRTSAYLSVLWELTH